MNTSLYPASWNTEIRPFILKRDKYSCRHCKEKQGQIYLCFERNKAIQTILHVVRRNPLQELENIKMRRLMLLCSVCHIKYLRNFDLKKQTNSRRVSRKKRDKIKKQKLEKRYYYWGL